MLSESCKKECAIAVEWASESEADLLLAVVRLKAHERVLGVESAVANEVEGGAVKVV